MVRPWRSYVLLLCAVAGSAAATAVGWLIFLIGTFPGDPMPLGYEVPIQWWELPLWYARATVSAVAPLAAVSALALAFAPPGRRWRAVVAVLSTAGVCSLGLWAWAALRF